MKKRIFLGLIVAVLCVVLVGCGKKKDPLIASWVSVDYGDSFVYTFNEDGTGTYLVAGNKMEFTYKTDGDKISITYTGNTASFDTTYSIKDDVLNIKDSLGEDTLYKRK